jgi:hypothetical protein
MVRKCVLQLCGCAIAMSSAAVALGQYSSPSSGSAGLTLNQLALRNAQQIMQQAAQQPNSGMQGAGRIGLGIETLEGFNYSTLVQPELQQQQFQQKQQQQNVTTTRRLQAISAMADYNVQGAKDQFPTGHQTVFQYMGHYYPQQRPHQKKKAQ